MADESKLPKWARDEMAALRRRVERAEVDRDAIVKGGDPSKCDGFWLAAGLSSTIDYPIPTAGRKLIYREDKGDITLRRVSDQSGSWLELNTRGRDGLVLRPWVTNVIHVRTA